ncbi:MAG: hypothetical protein ACRCZS_02305 [Chroococcidiopsis sp.]
MVAIQLLGFIGNFQGLRMPENLFGIIEKKICNIAGQIQGLTIEIAQLDSIDITCTIQQTIAIKTGGSLNGSSHF